MFFHLPSQQYFEPQNPRHQDWVTLRVRCDASQTVRAIYVAHCPDGEQEYLPLEPSAQGSQSSSGWDCHWWLVRLRLHNRRLSYRFLIELPDRSLWLTAQGIFEYTPLDSCNFVVLADFQPPRWVSQTVFYQVFPDRFRASGRVAEIQPGQWLVDGEPVVPRRWGELPMASQCNREFFGGDLFGVGESLQHLTELGVNGLYLNPIFTAPSNHKYDVASYSQVDPHLGGQAALAELRLGLRERNIRLLLDIVPNHCGNTHPWFLSALREYSLGDDSGDQPQTRDFFSFWPDDPSKYVCWLGHRTLPKLNYRSAGLRQRMYAGPDSVMRTWLRPPIEADGWRVDVANMLGRQGETDLSHKVLRGMRRAVKEESHEKYFLGESFFDATSALQGDELDATMNYRGFLFPLLQWLLPVDAQFYRQAPMGSPHPLSGKALHSQWQAYRAAIPWQLALLQLNLLGSHDTPRILTLCAGDLQRLKTAFLILMTYPGPASIYYGDEIGMQGGKDPDNRRCMQWECDRGEPFAFVAKLVRLRRELSALAQGAMVSLDCSNSDAIAWIREDPNQRLVIVARRAPGEAFMLDLTPSGWPKQGRLCDLLEQRPEIAVREGMARVPAQGAQLWSFQL